MSRFNKFMSVFLTLCFLSFGCGSSFAADKNLPLSSAGLPLEFQSEKTSNTVLKYFLGPKAQQGEYWADVIKNCFYDYSSSRKNFAFNDNSINSTIKPDEKFDKQLQELKDILHRNHPYYSPRYLAHMLSEQSMPSVVGYFTGLLYNTNNSTAEASPATTTLEFEYGKSIAEMFGYNTEKSSSAPHVPISWTHLTSGGSVANLESLWISRFVSYSPLLVWDVLNNFGLKNELPLSSELSDTIYVADMDVLDILRMPPEEKIKITKTFFDYFCTLAQNEFKSGLDDFIKASDFNVRENGINRCNQALEKLNGRPIKPLYFVPYTAHYCFPKIVAMLGEGSSSIVKVPVDENFRMDVNALKKIINAKLFNDNGECDYYVSYVVAVAGTTEEGAVDPIDKILEFRNELESGKYGKKSSFWLHIDGAWGGFFKTILGLSDDLSNNRYFKSYEHFNSLSDAEKEKIAEVNRSYLNFKNADSITVDPHKMGYIPYSAGAISFKNRNALILIKQLASYINDSAKNSTSGVADSLSDLDNVKAFSPYVFECSRPGAAAASCWFSEKLMPYTFDEKNPTGTYHGDIVFDSYKGAQQLHYYLNNFDKIYGAKINSAKNDPDGLKKLINVNGSEGVEAFRLIPISKTIDTNVVCFVAVPADCSFESGKISFKPCTKINGRTATPEQVVDYTIDINNKLYAKYSYKDSSSATNDPSKFDYFLSKTDFNFYTQNSEKNIGANSNIYNESHDVMSFVSEALGINDFALKEKLRKNLKILRATVMSPWHNNVCETSETSNSGNNISGIIDDIQSNMLKIISK